MLALVDVLTPAELRSKMTSPTPADGAATAGVFVRTVKHNKQAEISPETQKLQQLGLAALFRHPLIERAARCSTASRRRGARRSSAKATHRPS
jgi:hypothetical protein